MMKRIFAAIAALLCLAGANAQTIKGSGHVTTRTVDVPGFSKINLNGLGNVYISQGSGESVKVETDDNLQEKVIVETKGNTLYIRSVRGSWSKVTKMEIHITFKNIDELQNNLVGNLFSQTVIRQPALRYTSAAIGQTTLEVETKELKLALAAVGRTSLEGKADNCDLENSSVGFVDAADLEVGNITISNTAVGALDYNAKNTVSLRNSGIGRVTNKAKKQAR